MTSGGATLASIYHTKLKADEMSTGWYYTKNLTSSFFIPLHNFMIFCVPQRFKHIASLQNEILK